MTSAPDGPVPLYRACTVSRQGVQQTISQGTLARSRGCERRRGGTNAARAACWPCTCRPDASESTEVSSAAHRRRRQLTAPHLSSDDMTGEAVARGGGRRCRARVVGRRAQAQARASSRKCVRGRKLARPARAPPKAWLAEADTLLWSPPSIPTHTAQSQSLAPSGPAFCTLSVARPTRTFLLQDNPDRPSQGPHSAFAAADAAASKLSSHVRRGGICQRRRVRPPTRLPCRVTGS